MGRKIICDSCGAVMPFEKIKDAEVCPVCNVPFDTDNSDNSDHDELPNKVSNQSVEKKTYYYYKEGGGTLDEMLFNGWKPIYTFQATDMEDAERQLKEVCPNSPLLKATPSKVVRCPRCASTEYTLLNKGYSIFTGFLGSGRIKRVCNYCKIEF